MRPTRFLLLSLALLLPAAPPPARADDVDPFDQSKAPLGQDTDDPKLAKVVLLAGTPSHGPGEHEFFAGSALLLDLLKQTPGVHPVMISLAKNGWPKDGKVFENARAVVIYCDGGGGHPLLKDGRADALQPLIDKGVGFVNLHYAVEYPKAAGERVARWLGGYYETGYSINPTWEADFKELPAHPITQGVKPFKIRDEWYYNMRWVDDAQDPKKVVTPILRATPPDGTRGTPSAKEHPGREEIMAWAFERPAGGRAFGFTGGHFHKNWGDENFRRTVVNAVLWAAKVDVPADGAKVDLAAGELLRNMDAKSGKPKPKAPAK